MAVLVLVLYLLMGLLALLSGNLDFSTTRAMMSGLILAMAGLGTIIFMVVLFMKYRLRASGTPLRVSFLLHRQAWPIPTLKAVLEVLTVLVVMAVSGFLGWIAGKLVGFDPSLGIFIAVSVAPLLSSFIWDAGDRRRERLRRRQLAQSRTSATGMALALQAPDAETLVAWIGFDSSWIARDSIAARSLLRIGLWRSASPEYVSTGDEPPILRMNWTRGNMIGLYASLLRALDKNGWIINVAIYEPLFPRVLADVQPASSEQPRI